MTAVRSAGARVEELLDGLRSGPPRAVRTRRATPGPASPCLASPCPGSPRAAWILEHWAKAQLKFIKVFPHEYKRVLGVERVDTIYCPPTNAAPQAEAAAQEVQHG